VDDGEEIEKTRHDYVQVAGSRCNAQHSNDVGGEGEGGIMVPGPPAESDRAGRLRSYLVSGSLLHCATVLR